jgi:enoyl-CoA hydratase/carnithine racemase
MDYTTLDVCIDGDTTRITLNRPAVLNAINQRMHDELQHAFDQFAADNAQSIAVVSGAGERAFCAGSDLKAIAAAGAPNVYPASGYAGLIERFDLNKPVIAAVDGVAVGGGFELALACDLIIATRRSRFGLPEPMVGAMALGGGVHRLARQAGLKQAMGLILTGDIIGAEQAEKMGFITELVPDDGLSDAVNSWCERISRCAPSAIRASKQSVMRGMDEPGVQAAMSAQPGYPAFADWVTSEDRHEGAAAFAEKRPPNWEGR